jgi:hypothetical protein
MPVQNPFPRPFAWVRFERLNVQIDRFLIGLGKQLQPSGVSHRHGVGMVIPDIDRRADRAVAQVITIGSPRPEAL